MEMTNKGKSIDIKVEGSSMERQIPDWDEPLACQLFEILHKSLLQMLNIAKQKIYEVAYPMDIAEEAILKSSIIPNPLDVATNVAEAALYLLKRERACFAHKPAMFRDLNDLAAYTILEAINVLRELSPAVTAADAMWYLLLSDMNLLQACGMVERLSPKGQVSGSNPVEETDVSASGNEEDVRTLLPFKKALEKELQGVTDWANNKVMQVAWRLGRDKKELGSLRKGKEELKEVELRLGKAERRLRDLEVQLEKDANRIQADVLAIKKVEEEQSSLKDQLKSTDDDAFNEEINLYEAMEREQDLAKKMEAGDAEKELLSEELENVRRIRFDISSRIEHSKRRRDQLKALWKHEEKVNLDLQKRIEAQRRKMEEAEARAETEEEKVRQNAEREKQKCKETLDDLESKVSELRVELDRPKIEALNVSYGTHAASGSASSSSQFPKLRKRLPVFQGNFGGDSSEPNRECIMCMLREISVVFLPCCHEILCEDCNALHEQQGMTDCPSCRTTIRKRISATFRAKPSKQ